MLVVGSRCSSSAGPACQCDSIAQRGSLVHQAHIIHEPADKEMRVPCPAGQRAVVSAGQSLPRIRPTGRWSLKPFIGAKRDSGGRGWPDLQSLRG